MVPPSQHYDSNSFSGNHLSWHSDAKDRGGYQLGCRSIDSCKYAIICVADTSHHRAVTAARPLWTFVTSWMKCRTAPREAEICRGRLGTYRVLRRCCTRLETKAMVQEVESWNWSETVWSGLLTTFTFLGSPISWWPHTCQQWFHPLTILGQNKLEQKLLVTFHHCTIESVLVYPIATWYTGRTAAERKVVQRVIRSAEKALSPPWETSWAPDASPERSGSPVTSSTLNTTCLACCPQERGAGV